MLPVWADFYKNIHCFNILKENIWTFILLAMNEKKWELLKTECNFYPFKLWLFLWKLRQQSPINRLDDITLSNVKMCATHVTTALMLLFIHDARVWDASRWHLRTYPRKHTHIYCKHTHTSNVNTMSHTQAGFASGNLLPSQEDLPQGSAKSACMHTNTHKENVERLSSSTWNTKQKHRQLL